MSDILIKGMEIPKIDLEWRIIRGKDGKWYAIDVNAETSDGEWHEIVPVPPHGRLIDADALYERAKLRSERFNGCFNDLDNVINALYIETFPTVIEAEEGE